MTYYNQGANAKTKRCKRGNESRWNRLGEPFAHLLGGYFKTIDTWINRKTTMYERKYKNHLTSVELNTTGAQQDHSKSGVG